MNNPQNNKFSNKYQQSVQSKNGLPQKNQQANDNQEIADGDVLKGCAIHLCGIFGFCFLAAGIVYDGAKVPIIIIPVIKFILFFVGGNQTLCCIVGVVLLLIYGVFYLLYKDKYFNN